MPTWVEIVLRCSAEAAEAAEDVTIHSTRSGPVYLLPHVLEVHDLDRYPGLLKLPGLGYNVHTNRLALSLPASILSKDERRTVKIHVERDTSKIQNIVADFMQNDIEPHSLAAVSDTENHSSDHIIPSETDQQWRLRQIRLFEDQIVQIKRELTGSMSAMTSQRRLELEDEISLLKRKMRNFLHYCAIHVDKL